MADKAKSDGTHIIEPVINEKQNTPVELVDIEWDGKSIQVPKESADAVKESLRTMESGLKTKHEAAMAEAKAYREKVDTDLDTDLNFYESNDNQKAWKSYVPLVKGGDGYKGDPALLGISKSETNDSYVEPTTSVEPVAPTEKQTAMKPDPIVQELAQLRKEQEEIKLQIARGEGQKTLSIMDSVIADPKLNFAKRAEVLSEVKDYFDRTGGQQPSKQTIRDFVQASHDSTKELINKAGSFVDKPRYEGTSPSGGMPREKVTGIPGNPFGTQAEKDEANQALADIPNLEI